MKAMEMAMEMAMQMAMQITRDRQLCAVGGLV